MNQATWIEAQPGSVVQFEKVPHTFLSESTGEMLCATCNTVERTVKNSGMRLDTKMRQDIAFEKFTEWHLHGLVVPHD